MKKFLFSSPLATLVIILLICSISFVIINACRKVEHKDNMLETELAIRNRFFTVPATTNPIVKAIAQSIYRQDQQRDFVPALSEKAGYPVWNKAIISQKSVTNSQSRLEGGGGDTGEVVMIPFVKVDKYVTNAILLVNTGSLETRDTTYKLVYDSHYEDYGFDYSDTTKAGAKNIFHLFSVFDNELFGYTKFLIKDRRIISGELNDTIGESKVTATLIDGPGNSYENRLTSITLCNTYQICKDDCYARTAGLMSADCPCGYYNSTVCSTVWIGIGGGGISGGGSTGGGGGNWEDTNPCREVDENFNPCSGGGDNGPGGWEPVEDENPYNPNSADTVGVSNYLRDSFPCLYSFLKDSLPNINYLAQLAGANVFDDSAYMHLTFDTSTVNITANNPAATTVPGPGLNPVFVDGDGVTHFQATIKFNPWYLKNATKEYMVNTIIHEAMHAIFILRWGQYLNWLQYHDTPYDSNYIKTRFPIYWYAIQNQTVPLNQLQDHEIMAADYANLHASLTRPFFNPAATTAIRDTVLKAMGYGGLHKTTAWKMLPGMGIDTCKYKGIQVAAERSATGNLTPAGCSSAYKYHYANDWFMRPSCN